MEYRSLGRTGVMVSPLCLGAMNFGGPTNEEDSIAIINRPWKRASISLTRPMSIMREKVK